jgi:hypothetical protein
MDRLTASLLITQLDFRVHLDPEEDTRAERESLARKAYATLSSVPIEYLASNGESMRGKVLRIVLDLLSMTRSEEANTTPMQGEDVGDGEGAQPFGKDVWDWWNMVRWAQCLYRMAWADSPVFERTILPGHPGSSWCERRDGIAPR